MPRGRFEYDPSSDGWIDPTDPSGIARSFEEVTDGRFFARGPNLYYTPDSRYVGRIAFSAGSNVVVAEDGGVYVTNNVARYQLDQETGPWKWVTGNLSGTAELPDGSVISFTGERVNLAPEGELVYVHFNSATGENDYARPGDARLGDGSWRPATPQELLDRGRVGYLMHNAADQLRAFAQTNEAAAEGLSAADIYGVAQWVASRLEISGSITTDITGIVGL